MTILVIESNDATRRGLRVFLKAMRPAALIETASITQAQGLISELKNRLRLIVAEFELCQSPEGLFFLESLEKNGDLSWVPLLLLSSNDVHLASARWTLNNRPRVDTILIKPFNKQSLLRAVDTTFACRYSKRKTLIYLGDDAQEFGQVAHAAEIGKWKYCFQAKSEEEWKVLLEDYKRGIGALVLSSNFCLKWGTQWLSKYKRSPLGKLVPVMALDRSTQTTTSLRLNCNIFVEKPTDSFTWQKRIQQLRSEVERLWEFEKISLQLKGNPAHKRIAKVNRISKSILSSNVIHSETYAQLGQYYFSMKKNALAISHFEKCLELNPSHPEAYIRLLELMANEAASKFLPIAEKALQYCPAHEQTLRQLQKLYLQHQLQPQLQKVEARLNEVVVAASQREKHFGVL